MFKFVKREEISKKKSIIITFIAVILALIVSSVFIMFIGENPIKVYIEMIKGAFGSTYRIKETIINAIPLVITALGISIAFKMQFWNIGAEGQIAMGAFAAAFIPYTFPHLNKPTTLILMMIFGVIGGGLWAVIAGVLKAYLGTNETIITLMLNYIALKWIVFLQYGPWKDKGAMGFPRMKLFEDNAILPNFMGIHIGWVIALILIIGVYIFMNYTKKGYEISVIGESENTALYAGINIKKNIVIALLISGGLCGLTGMIQASAVSNTLSIDVSGGMGYTAIIVAWLSRLSSPIMALVSILFAGLLEGGSYIQTSIGIPDAVASVIQAVILFFVLGSDMFIKYKLVYTKQSVKTLDKKINLKEERVC